MEITKEKLEKVVGNYRHYIYNTEDEIRCHEIARFLSNELKQKGNNVKVYDGEVRYAIRFLSELKKKEFNLKKTGDEYEDSVKDIFTEMFEEEFKDNGFTSWKLHSWCEVDGFVIDYHKRLKISTEKWESPFLLIEKKKKLIGKVEYNIYGKEINLNCLPYIQFSPLGDIVNYFVKLNPKFLTKTFLKSI